MPKVTVLMSVFNGEQFLGAAIESILGQTLSDFEFLIMNDGSTDKSKDIVLSYRDPRIRFVENERNLGLIASLNKGLDLARGEYIARMDADDISYPERLQLQVDYMDNHPKVGACGTCIKIFGDGIRLSTLRSVPDDHETIRTRLLFVNSINHSTVMLRKSFFDRFALRYGNFKYAEDYELWIRCIEHFELHNLPDFTIRHRISETSVTRSNPQGVATTVIEILRRQFARLGLEFDDRDIAAFRTVAIDLPIKDSGDLERLRVVYEEIRQANAKLKVYRQDLLNDLLNWYWHRACTDFGGNPIVAFRIYAKTSFKHDLFNSLKFFPNFVYRRARRTLSSIKSMLYAHPAHT
jgi:glycosyltransferase involved in cell wall biosynthesis